MHTITPYCDITPTIKATENIENMQNQNKTKKTRFTQWAKHRLVKAWPTIKNLLIANAIITAIAAPIIGVGVGIVALYVAGYYTAVSIIAIILAMLATPPILIAYACSQGVAG